MFDVVSGKRKTAKVMVGKTNSFSLMVCFRGANSNVLREEKVL